MAGPGCVLGHLGQIANQSGQETVVTDGTAATTMMTLAVVISYFRRYVSSPRGPARETCVLGAPQSPCCPRAAKQDRTREGLASPPELHWDLPELSFETKNCTV